ncbi:MAG: YciI family protein [Geminicoccaceae bacterium]
MPFAILALDKPDSTKLRADLRPTHLAYLEQHAPQLLAGGAILGEDGATPIGSLLIYDTEERAVAEDFAANDPFRLNGLFQSVSIYPWRKVFFDGKRLM